MNIKKIEAFLDGIRREVQEQDREIQEQKVHIPQNAILAYAGPSGGRIMLTQQPNASYQISLAGGNINYSVNFRHPLFTHNEVVGYMKELEKLFS